MNSDQKPVIPGTAEELREAQQRHAEARRRQREALAAARDQGVTADDLRKAADGLPFPQRAAVQAALDRQARRAREAGDPRLGNWWGLVAQLLAERCQVEESTTELLRGVRRFEP
ncbi:MAG: hypothetical protein M0R75_15175 [Dehalococcoidia bacterium]|nr:hypothetical protein [Dehalococcoidia bacterium]